MLYAFSAFRSLNRSGRTLAALSWARSGEAELPRARGCDRDHQPQEAERLDLDVKMGA